MGPTPVTRPQPQMAKYQDSTADVCTPPPAQSKVRGHVEALTCLTWSHMCILESFHYTPQANSTQGTAALECVLGKASAGTPSLFPAAWPWLFPETPPTSTAGPAPDLLPSTLAAPVTGLKNHKLKF